MNLNNIQEPTKDELQDCIFETFDALLYDGKFAVVGIILNAIRIECLSVSALRGILVSTMAAKDKLENREDFYSRVYARVVPEVGIERTERLFGRLK